MEKGDSKNEENIEPGGTTQSEKKKSKERKEEEEKTRYKEGKQGTRREESSINARDGVFQAKKGEGEREGEASFVCV